MTRAKLRLQTGTHLLFLRATNRVLCMLVAAISFGSWQDSIAAGAFLFAVLWYILFVSEDHRS